ncbi:MAG: substrate-binding domain-containing protein [Taibaiella sp.]|nr:substrate-binding domain-containing protein [Taibaiella sp.]
MRLLGICLLLFSFTMLGLSCDDTPPHEDTLSSGTIEVSADETYRTVIEAQSKVFDSSFPNAKVNIHYKSEGECFKDYFDNKARIILVTRELTKEEKEVCKQKQIFPSSVPLAKDAVAVLLNNESTDSLLSVDQVKAILTGEYKKKYTVVFDNQSSSLVRYITDSMLQGRKLGNNVFAAKGNKAVIEYIEKNPDAIGFAGLADVADTTDVNNTGTFITNVRVAGIYSDSLKHFVKPYLAYIGLKDYPLVRKLYYVSRESYPGLGTGFANFLGGYRGQLIFAHAHLFPLRMEVTIRDAEINQN